MAKLIDLLRRSEHSKGMLNPRTRSGERGGVDEADIEWFQGNYPHLAEAEAPLDDEVYAQLSAIDEFWALNAARWRSEGLI